PAMPMPASGQTTAEITYQGMMVAAVAATDPWLAQQAASAIKVTYDVHPFVTDMDAAVLPNAPIATLGSTVNYRNTNVFTWNDVDAGMQEAEVTKTYESGWASFYSHNSPETREATAQWIGDELWVWIASQQLTGHSQNIAEAMGIDESKCHVISHGCGGGYGDRKPNGEEAWIAATLAKKTGMPVLCMESREVNATGGATHQSQQQCTIKLGSKRDGTMTAIDAQWKGTSGNIHIEMTAAKCKNWRIVGMPITTNVPVTGPFRSVSGMHGCFTTDPVFELMAEELGMNPLDYRLKISPDIEDVDPATKNPRGVTCMREVIQKCADEFKWRDKYHDPGTKTLDDGRLHGVGMCHIVSEKGAGSPGRTTIIRANPDGSFHANFGIGRASSGTSTALCVLIAETLGTTIDKVNCTVGDSVVSGYGGSQAGSQGTNANGWGAYDAAVAIRNYMFGRAANTLSTTVDDLDSKDGLIFRKSDPTKTVTHANAIGGNCVIRYGDGNVLGSGFFRDYGPWKEGQATTIRTYLCQMVEIAVDPETGEIEVLDWVLIDDVGRALFPNGVLHQIEGAMTMQLGVINAWEQLFDPTTGATVNGTFIDQKNPTALDVPVEKMRAAYYESNNNSSPYGVMGCGEPSMIPYVAFHNAFYNATGVRIGTSTIGPARALKALGKI
ncbi:MAG: xanthine dehydrogenase family protein molybdopterin-binding subunit, partial [Dehalococcoidia bacterium]|nr:xanthine dehydrogenase family protein molybdopterin-binding subunit [Dehalococcoidia bacterium]